jgi:diguanylate cyclase (GGDEF)-like protein
MEWFLGSVSMRAITGWRFLFVIVLPLTLAISSAVMLIYDLLSNVENSGNWAENSRNRVVINEAFMADARELARLAADNARWSDAFQRTSGSIDQDWFHQTWGRTISVGTSYHLAAVIDGSSGKVLIHNSYDSPEAATAEALLGFDYQSWQQTLPRAAAELPISGFALTAKGPAAVAAARIVDPANHMIGNGRILVLAKLLTQSHLTMLEKRLFVSEIRISPFHSESPGGLQLSNPAQINTLAVNWSNKPIGGMVADFAWKKASPVMGFLILVMSGIVYVCWRLVQQVMKREEQATHDSLHDHLTGLANRSALVNTLKDMQRSNAGGYCVAFADLDGFKEINDSYGHEYGDRLICMVAAGISQLAQGARLVARMGGDEFVILYHGDRALVRAKQFSERLIKMLGQPFDMDGRLALVGASIGIAECNGTGGDTEVLRRADVAMYKAKSEGKNRACVFEESFDNERRETLSIAAELKQILQDDRLEVAFQPVVSAKSGEITGVEALARWPSSSARQVMAERFITVAESAGLIDDLGDAILAKACEAARAWPMLRLAVNISAVQLNNPRFVERALSTLAGHNIPPNRMEFEITETSLIHDSDRAKQVFKALQGVGIKIALDDFGTGFSSIGYLRRYNFDRIKIDKSIVSKVLSSPAELAVVQGVLLVARGLSAEVTAEGVERQEEAKVLHLAGCSELQGYYFHRPMEASEVSVLVAQGKAATPVRARIVA